MRSRFAALKKSANNEAQFQAHVSDTVFLANESKARCVEVSRDVYAKLWTTPETGALWEEFAAAACPNDHIELSLRNRFFLDRLEQARRRSADTVFVNIASGFSSYPFLIDSGCRSFEIDLPHIVDHKTRTVAGWQEDGTFPKRDVQYLALDLLDETAWSGAAARLGEALRGSPSFVLLEGITYYLPLPVLERIFTFLAQVQQPGSIVAVEYWQPDLRSFPAFQRLEEFFSARFNVPAKTYTFLDREYFEALDDYAITELSSTTEQEPVYFGSAVLADRNTALPGYFCMLERTS